MSNKVIALAAAVIATLSVGVPARADPIASALCGSATSLTQLVLYRVLQGICGAALVLQLLVLSGPMPRDLSDAWSTALALTL